MEYILFVFYLVFFAWLVTKTKFFLATGLSKPQLVIIFLLKVIIGIFYGWMGLYYGGLAQMVDTWGFHYHGIAEYQLLGTNPHEYFTNLFHNPYGNQNFFGSTNSYWNDLKGNIFIKLLSLFDILSFGHYYVNVIFFSFLTLFGPMAIFRVMNDVYPGKRLLLIFATFLVPSFFYWSSGIHKEGLIFTGLALIIYHIYFASKEKKYSIKRIAGILLGFALLVTLRNFLLIILVPAILAWILANRWPKYGLICFACVYVFSGILFFTLRYVDPRLDFPKAVVNKQQAFLQMAPGNSTIPIGELRPNAISFVKNIPQAITLSAVRPYPSDIKHLLSLAAALEINLLLLLFVVSLIFRVKSPTYNPNVIYFCTFFSISLLLVIGFSVNNLGAIVRYRSVIIPLVVIPMVMRINWDRVTQLFSRGINLKNNISKEC